MQHTGGGQKAPLLAFEQDRRVDAARVVRLDVGYYESQ